VTASTRGGLPHRARDLLLRRTGRPVQRYPGLAFTWDVVLSWSLGVGTRSLRWQQSEPLDVTSLSTRGVSNGRTTG
jgi:hypothetical protein